MEEYAPGSPATIWCRHGGPLKRSQRIVILAVQNTSFIFCLGPLPREGPVEGPGSHLLAKIDALEPIPARIRGVSFCLFGP